MSSLGMQGGKGGDAAQWEPNVNDLRPDGSRKGMGWLGRIPTADGGVMTEQTAEMDVNGETIAFPLIHPGSTKEDLDIMAKGGRLPRESVMKALDHALERRSKGLSPYNE